MGEYRFLISATVTKTVEGYFTIEAESREQALEELREAITDRSLGNSLESVCNNFDVDWETRVDMHTLTGDAQIYVDDEDDYLENYGIIKPYAEMTMHDYTLLDGEG